MTERELWHIERVSADEYERLVPDRKVFFNEPKFTELNKSRADEIYYLVIFRENSARFGLILGKCGNMGRCPFSAPYSYPVAIINESKIDAVDAALDVLEDYCQEQEMHSLRFIFPPLFYYEHVLSGWISAFYRKRYIVENLDVNYAIDLKKFNVEESEYGAMIPEKGRKALRKARKSGLEVVKCITEDEYRQAYEIVKIGHEFKGFPVKLSFEQLMDTMKLVGHDAFLVKQGNVNIVGEFLYQVNSEIVQGIYTGTHPDYMNCNGMNLLTWHTIKYYGEKGYKILDKAISTEDSIPNYGLCNFKESVGCDRSLKYTFRKELKRG